MPGTDRTDHTNEFAGRLNDWLDRLVIDAPPADAGIDPDTVATVGRFFARDDAPPPPPDLADQVWNSIMRGAPAMPHGSDALVVTQSNGNGRHSVARQAIPVSVWTGPAPVAGRTSRVTPAARRWGAGFAQATSVLLLVLMLGLGYLALMLGTGSNRGPGAILPAPTHPAVDMAAAETLYSLTLSPEDFPRSPERGISPEGFVVEPGTTGEWPGTSAICCSGVRVDYVVDGVYTVRADGPIDVRRADGREETIPAGTETVLGPGDRMLVPDGIGFTNANNGDAPVHVVGWYVHEGLVDSVRTAGNWTGNRCHCTLGLPPDTDALTLELHRVQLAPGTLVPAAGSAQFVISLDKSAMLGEQSDGSIRNAGRAEITAYVLTATMASSDPVVDGTGQEGIETTDPAVDMASAESLLSLTLPANILPDAADRWIGLVNIMIEPGTTGQWLSNSPSCCPGARIDYVVEGAYSVVPDGPIDVRWADGREETVPAGTEIVLGPGDRMLVPEGIGFTNTNAGSVPVRVVGWYLYHGSNESVRSTANWLSSTWRWGGALPVQDGALTLELQQVRLDPGVTVPPSLDSAQFVASLDANALLGEQSDGGIRNVGRAEITAYILTATSAPSDTAVDATKLESEPSPAAQVGEDGETLLSLTLTSDLFPADVWDSAVLVNATIPPRTEGAWPGMESPCCASVRIDYVAQGNVTIRAEDDVQVVWAGGRLETVPAHEEIVLGPGDTLITPRDIPFVNANSGGEAVRLIGWILDAGEAWQTEVSNWHHDSSADLPPSADFPSDPKAITLTLRQAEIPAGGDVPATPGALRFVASLDPAAMLGERSDGTVRNVGSTTATAYVLTLEPAEAE